MLRRNLALSLSAAAVLCLAAPGWSQEKPTAIYTKDNAPAAPKLDELPLKDSLSQYGMTWKFEQAGARRPIRQRRFLRGRTGDDHQDYPSSLSTALRSPPLSSTRWTSRSRRRTACAMASCSIRPPRMKVSYDSGVRNWFDPSLIQKASGRDEAGRFARLDHQHSRESSSVSRCATATRRTRGEEDNSPVKDAAVLTCVAEPLPADAFRPSFCDRTQQIYLARNLKRELLPSLVRPADAATIEEYIRYTQRPWVNTGFFGFEEPRRQHALVRPAGRRMHRRRRAAPLHGLHSRAKRAAARQLRPGRN